MQTKGALGWSQYQVRADLAIRRHWQLVCCAFSFCWYHQSRAPGGTVSATEGAEQPAEAPSPAPEAGREKNQRPTGRPASSVVARGAAPRPGVVGAVDHAVALLARVVERAPTTGAPAAA